jgi:hypothetical protein
MKVIQIRDGFGIDQLQISKQSSSNPAKGEVHARAIITSSHDDKLAQAHRLGADLTIN